MAVTGQNSIFPNGSLSAAGQQTAGGQDEESAGAGGGEGANKTHIVKVGKRLTASVNVAGSTAGLAQNAAGTQGMNQTQQ